MFSVVSFCFLLPLLTGLLVFLLFFSSSLLFSSSSYFSLSWHGLGFVGGPSGLTQGWGPLGSHHHTLPGVVAALHSVCSAPHPPCRTLPLSSSPGTSGSGKNPVGCTFVHPLRPPGAPPGEPGALLVPPGATPGLPGPAMYHHNVNNNTPGMEPFKATPVFLNPLGPPRGTSRPPRATQGHPGHPEAPQGPRGPRLCH